MPFQQALSILLHSSTTEGKSLEDFVFLAHKGLYGLTVLQSRFILFPVPLETISFSMHCYNVSMWCASFHSLQPLLPLSQPVSCKPLDVLFVGGLLSGNKLQNRCWTQTTKAGEYQGRVKASTSVLIYKAYPVYLKRSSGDCLCSPVTEYWTPPSPGVPRYRCHRSRPDPRAGYRA